MRAVGSDFESLDSRALLVDQVPPWEEGGAATAYLETGRQALSLLGAHLHARGRSRLFVPGYLCESMVAPFLGGQWTIEAVPLTDDLRYPTLSEVVLDGDFEDSVFLMADYFGRAPDSTHISFALDARARGAVVIEDETHRVFRPGASFADISFASLRKLLPVGDGAYLQGDREIIDAASRLSPSTSTRWTAMDAKSRALSGAAEIDFRRGFLEANEALERVAKPRRATSRTLDVLRRLPYDSMADARRRNAGHLRERLREAGVRALATGDEDVPSHLVAIVRDPRRLQKALAADGVFCAIHWPEVQDLSGNREWRRDLLSIPVDHRYEEEDMERVAALIIEAST